MPVNNGPQLIKGAFKAHRETNKTIVVDAAADAAKVKMKAVVLDTFKVLFAVKLNLGPWKYSKTKTPDQNINVCSFQKYAWLEIEQVLVAKVVGACW